MLLRECVYRTAKLITDSQKPSEVHLMIRFLSGSQHPRLSVSALPPLLPRQRFVGSNYNKTLHLLKIFFLNWQNESLREGFDFSLLSFPNYLLT